MNLENYFSKISFSELTLKIVVQIIVNLNVSFLFLDGIAHEKIVI